MKKFLMVVALFVLAAATLCVPLHAQNDSLSWEQTMPRHDVHLSIGDPFFTTVSYNSFYSAGTTAAGIFGKAIGGFLTTLLTLGTVQISDWDETQSTDWFISDYVRVNTGYTPTINVGYEYRFKKWFWFGATLSYAGSFNRWVDRVSKEYGLRTNFHYVGLTPTFRFSWLNKTHVTLYSGFSIGLGYDFGTISSGKTYLESLQNSKEISRLTFAGQLNLIGVKAGGQHWYGFAEVGVGTHGCVQAGFGYHFKSQKTK